MGVNITTMAYLRVLIIEIGDTSKILGAEASSNASWEGFSNGFKVVTAKSGNPA